MRLTLKNKLMLFFCILVIVPLMVGNIVQYSLNNRATLEHIQRLNDSNARLAGATVNNVMQSIFTFSQYLGVENNIVRYLSVPEGQSDALWKSQSLNVISLLSTANNYLTSICLRASDGRSIDRGGRVSITITDAEAERARALDGYYFWGSDKGHYDSTLYLCRMLRDVNNLSHTLGFVKVSVSADRLAALLAPPADYPVLCYLIADDNDALVMSAGDSALLASASLQGVMQADAVGGAQHLREALGDRGFVADTGLAGGWRLYSLMSADGQVSLLPELLQTILFQSVLCFLFCMLLAQVFIAYALKPLKQLGQLMQQVGKGDFSVQFGYAAQDEIRNLADEFNEMSKQLDVLYNKIYASELEVMRSRLAEMEAKINPHFLYNCLDTIYWTAQMGKSEEVSGMVSALSKLFHMALSMDNSGLVSLSDELEYLQCYCTILFYRFGDDIEFDIEVDEALLRQTVSRFVLQPIVENAVTHGIQSQPGVVHIQIYREGQDIIYRISDTGGSVDPEEMDALLRAPEEAIQGTRGFALRNINSRIQIRFGEEYGLRVYRENGLSVFEVRQPYRGKADD